MIPLLFCRTLCTLSVPEIERPSGFSLVSAVESPDRCIERNSSNISFPAGERDKAKATIMLQVDLDDETDHWKYRNGSIVLKP